MSTTEILSSANALLASHTALLNRVRQSQQANRRSLHTLHSPPSELLRHPIINPPASLSPPDSGSEEEDNTPAPALTYRPDLPPAKRARVARYKNYVPEEETIRNDYNQRYVDSGEWPQNWVLGAELERRFEEYPKQQRLLALKKLSVNSHSLPASYLPFAALQTLHPNKFDAILIDPPYSSSFTFDHLQELPIPSLAADPSFVFLWVGSGAGEGLERGRDVLAKWGYRRCEDVVWVKTNKESNLGPGTDPPTTSLFTRTKQHCLIGIRGTVRRSTDSWLVHCNVDTDVIIWEGSPSDPTMKPPEMYSLIENFCLGTRRLEIFGRAARRGWVTVLGNGDERLEGATRWDKETWEEGIKELAASSGGKNVVPMTSEIDALRPKSPFRPGHQQNSSGGGNGGQQQQRFHHGNGGNNVAAPVPNRGGAFGAGQTPQMMAQQQQQAMMMENMMWPGMMMGMNPMAGGMNAGMPGMNAAMGGMNAMGNMNSGNMNPGMGNMGGMMNPGLMMNGMQGPGAGGTPGFMPMFNNGPWTDGQPQQYPDGSWEGMGQWNGNF